MLDLPAKFDKMGLGYNPLQDQNRASSSKSFISFTSGGVINEGNVLAVEEEQEDSSMDQWVRPSVLVPRPAVGPLKILFRLLLIESNASVVFSF